MSQEIQKNYNNATLIKFVAPHSLKETLSEMASERSVSLSALLRIISSEYIKRDQKIWSFPLPIKKGV